MGLISFIGSIFFIGLIIGIAMKHLYMFIVESIAYIGIKILENIIWRCPKCKAKLLRGGLMSIFWTQKVKLFYAALLANNSH